MSRRFSKLLCALVLVFISASVESAQSKRLKKKSSGERLITTFARSKNLPAFFRGDQGVFINPGLENENGLPPEVKQILLFLYILPTNALAQSDSGLKIPADVKAFVEPGATALWLESADLNGDGTLDFILVTENVMKAESDDARDDRQLLILVRGADGKLTLAKRNEKVVYCRSCGGAFGDPFAGVEVKRGGFTVKNYGGSSWRWSESYEFKYSSRDRTWQLVRVVQENFNALEPKKIKTKIRTPKNFGKIDLADFDPAATP
jgi:hypothetical protein